MKTRAKQPDTAATVQSKAKKQADAGKILQAYAKQPVQRAGMEEEEPAQRKSDTAQLEELDEEPAQRKEQTTQLAADEEEPVQPKGENRTGLPDNLKAGVENLSGYSMDDVKVHYNSAKPAGLQAHAYAQGTDIHVAPGQEKHLPHEAWHVAQQKQGRVQPTKQLKPEGGGVNINDDAGLEKEADVMGAKAVQLKIDYSQPGTLSTTSGTGTTAQLTTSVSYGNLQEFKYKTKKGLVSTSMNAHLDPADAKKGSDTGGSNAYSGLFNELQSKTKSTWVRGHLLNHDLGGLAIYNNLFPITTAANNEHKYEVEYPVKHWLEKGCEIDYSVTSRKTSSSDDSADGVFECDAKVTSTTTGYTGKRIQKNIHSKTAKTSSTKKYRKKKDATRSGFVSVDYGSGNNILRDDYKTHGVRKGWGHSGGNGSTNNKFFHNGELHDGSRLAGLQDIDEVDPEYQSEWLEISSEYGLSGLKIDGDLINEIIEYAQSEAESQEEFISLVIDELAEAGYTIKKK